MDNRRRSDVDWPAIQQCYGTMPGMSVRAIARRFELSESTVRTKIAADARRGQPWSQDLRADMRELVFYLIQRLDFQQLQEIARLIVEFPHTEPDDFAIEFAPLEVAK